MLLKSQVITGLDPIGDGLVTFTGGGRNSVEEMRSGSAVVLTPGHSAGPERGEHACHELQRAVSKRRND
jgi:hypothetical protein